MAFFVKKWIYRSCLYFFLSHVICEIFVKMIIQFTIIDFSNLKIVVDKTLIHFLYSIVLENVSFYCTNSFKKLRLTTVRYGHSIKGTTFTRNHANLKYFLQLSLKYFI